MSSPVCSFCRLDPYEYLDPGVGSAPVAVNCCELDWYLFDGGSEREHYGLSWLLSEK